MSYNRSMHVSRNECVYCRDKLPFELPVELLEALTERRVVVFAGAGVGTERKHVLKYSFYDEIAAELRCEDSSLPFPDLMSRFSKGPNGRARLLRRIQERLMRVRSFPETYRAATDFHRELSTLYLIDTVVTTNWDDFFEVECGAVPFTVPQDLPFWRVAPRRVLKIHGSSSNLGTIVVTREDYEVCAEALKTGALGSVLKTLLSTMIPVYVGYSFRDDDFLHVHALLKVEMGELFPQGYAITTDAESLDRLSEIGLVPIQTDATHFLHVIKDRLVEDDMLLPDSRFKILEALMDYVVEEHHVAAGLDPKRAPAIVYALMFQDGVIHALERAVALKKTGEYSDSRRMRALVARYRELRAERWEQNAFSDVAYIEGYIAGLEQTLVELTPGTPFKFPLYYCLQSNKRLASLEQFLQHIGDLQSENPQLESHARDIAESLGNRIVIHHQPWL